MSIKEANKYIEKNKIDKNEKPLFHVTAPIGWINDPNGFSYYKGNIHLFYQYHPYSINWGPMHWGHVMSKDMINWVDLPVALAPTEEFDKEGCFSGSAIETEKGHILVYTGVSKIKCEAGEEIRQNQYIAVGDGVKYEKLTTPVVSGNMLPENCSKIDFRDPKIWKENEKYYMVVGNKTKDNIGQVLLFSSDNIMEWKFENVICKSDGTLGHVWECPDFFTLLDKDILICSPQNLKAKEYEFHNGHNSVYFVGKLDRDKYEYTYDDIYSLDYGLDFYAPQTTLLPDGRRVLIAWLQSWDSLYTPESQKWQGMMTLPREISFVNGKIIQKPVKEIENYYQNKVQYEDYIIKDRCKIPNIDGRIIDMTLEISGNNYNEFSLDLANNDEYATKVTYKKNKGILEIDRNYSGVKKDIVCYRAMKVSEKNNVLKLRFILDKNSIEIFVNDGEKTSSNVIYTPLNAKDIIFDTDGQVQLNILKYDIVL